MRGLVSDAFLIIRLQGDSEKATPVNYLWQSRQPLLALCKWCGDPVKRIKQNTIELVNSNLGWESSINVAFVSRPVTWASKQTAKAAMEHKQEMSSLNLNLSLQAWTSANQPASQTAHVNLNRWRVLCVSDELGRHSHSSLLSSPLRH